jgi:hypothetical protein
LESDAGWVNFLNGQSEAAGAAVFELYDAKGSLVAFKQVHAGDVLRAFEFQVSSGMYLFSVRYAGKRTSVVQVIE